MIAQWEGVPYPKLRNTKATCSLISSYQPIMYICIQVYMCGVDMGVNVGKTLKKTRKKTKRG